MPSEVAHADMRRTATASPAATACNSASARCSAAGWSRALRARRRGRGREHARRRPRRCILIWMDGGPTHYETFDPKPDAPDGVSAASSRPIADRSARRPLLRAHDAAGGESATSSRSIRSIRHDQGNHGAGNHYMMTGAPPRIPVGCGAFVSFHPSLGSVVAAREAAPRPGCRRTSRMPSMSRSGGPNFLGAKYAPFVVAGDPNSAELPRPRRGPARRADRRAGSPTAPTSAAEVDTLPAASPTRRPATRPSRSTSTTSRATT